MKLLSSNQSHTRVPLPRIALAMMLFVILGSVIFTVHAATLVGDVNGDGKVDVFDLSQLLSGWGTGDAALDLNHDGAVNIFDLSLLLSNWGKTGPSPSAITTPTATITPAPTASSIMPRLNGRVLNLGSSSTRIKMHGVAVWGIKDAITGSFGDDEYNARQTVVNTIKAWGGNEIRLRLLASDYNSQAYMSQAQEIQEIKDWQSTAQAAGIYLHVTWWDSLDGPYNAGNWAAGYSQAFPMMNAVISALGPNNPWVFYEPFNEPNNVSESQWLSAMKPTVNNFRTHGYTGILLLDTNVWSHAYNDADMTALENYDAGQPGMGGVHQLIFSKHDYANEYQNPGAGFNSSEWPTNDGGSSAWNFNQHAAWETEFGNYNGDPSSVSYPWSKGAAAWMAQAVNDGTLVGASAFVFGPWYDVNAMTGNDNVSPTQWGGYVQNDFLKSSQ